MFKEWLIRKLGGVPVPKVQEGQYVRRITVCKNPVRKPKQENSVELKDTPPPISSFWKGKDFDELATIQGIYPINDLDKLSTDWPEDTDFDVFFEAVRSARA